MYALYVCYRLNNLEVASGIRGAVSNAKLSIVQVIRGIWAKDYMGKEGANREAKAGTNLSGSQPEPDLPEHHQLFHTVAGKVSGNYIL